MNAIIEKLKQNNEDYEFYPTTKEIINALYWDIKSHKKNSWYGDIEDTDEYEYQHISLLDIGSGNCKVYNTLKEISEENYINSDKYPSGKHRSDHKKSSNQMKISSYYVIEKSQILIDNMPSEAIIVGTDFHENTLIDKKSDIVFCNPPYSEYAVWMERIIKEANATYLYFVVPQRWGNNRAIADALKLRKAKVKIVGNFDFLNAEDRKARAKVSLVKVDLRGKVKRDYDDNGAIIDPFDLWFSETFKIQADKEETSSYQKERENKKKHQEKVENALVNAHDLVGVLVALYNKDIEKLIYNYQKVSELDSDILKELNVDIENLLKAFKSKISGLKNLYWQEIFNNLSEITSRLTSSTRSRLLGKLASNTNIDFTPSNIRSVVIWVIKNANKYLNDQLIEMYDALTREDSIKLYKSNAHFQKDSWRYIKEDKEAIKYALDYRIVYYSYRDYMDKDGFISKKQTQLLRDIVVVAKNLGFEIEDFSDDFYLKEQEYIYFKVSKNRKLKVGQKTDLGKIEETYDIEPEFQTAQGLYQYKINGEYHHWSNPKIDDDVFVAFRGHLNGNTHLKFNKRFIKKLNLEAGRLKGWIKSPQEAANEMDISIKEASEFWKSNFTLLPSSVSNLLPNIKEKDSKKEDVSVKPVNNEPYDSEQIEHFAETGTLF
jgi:hypothetical protein